MKYRDVGNIEKTKYGFTYAGIPPQARAQRGQRSPIAVDQRRSLGD